jgi:2-polyprenyl-3-methyl-5-hydroxy-6-metoxy-1,4-benzoquinol methylase
MSEDRNEFGAEYFRQRARYPTAAFKGRNLSFLKYPLWDRVIRKRIRSGKLCDIGCAEGRLLKWAEKRGYETYGVDISDFAIKEISYRKLSQTQLSVANINFLPFVDNYFDIITCFDVLEHLENPVIGLREISRCLRRQGLFVMSTPNINSKGHTWKGENWHGNRNPTHLSLLSAERWIALIEQNNLKLIDIFYDCLWDSPYFKKMPRYYSIFYLSPLC